MIHIGWDRYKRLKVLCWTNFNRYVDMISVLLMNEARYDMFIPSLIYFEFKDIIFPLNAQERKLNHRMKYPLYECLL